MIDSTTADVLQKVLIPQLNGQISKNLALKKFITLDERMIVIPNRSSDEHRKIAEYAKSPWAEKIVNSRVRRLKVSGIRGDGGSDEEAWNLWRSWKMIQKEKTVYREAITYGDSYLELRKNGNSTTPLNKSPFFFTAFYGFDDFNDAYNAEYPVLGLESNANGTMYKLLDNNHVYIFTKVKGSDKLELVKKELHGANHVPIVRYANDINSNGESIGEIKPLRHILLRIMKASYDSGMINHNNSWNVRYATGLSSVADVPQIAGETDMEYQRRVARMEEGLRLELGTSDLLTSTSKDTSFGSLPATPPSSFVQVIEQNLKELAAVSETPSDYLTGDIVAQSAEQASNSQANFLALIKEKQDIFGESHESLIRLNGEMLGIETPSYVSTIAWDESDNGVLAAKVDALGKAATMLKIPEQELWEDFPNMTPEKLERWKKSAIERDNQESAAMKALMEMGNEEASAASIAKDAELGE